MIAKSDVKSKQAYIKELERRGYENCRVTSSPADIIAEKDGEVYYFEIKMTKQERFYFGAATITEWEQAIKTPENYRFVVAKTDHEESQYEFVEYTPEEFMQFATIPPLKLYFNIDMAQPRCRVRPHRTAIPASFETIDRMVQFFHSLRSEQ